MNSFNEKPLELFIFYAKMFQTNTIFVVIFANPDLNTEKYGPKHGLKSLKYPYFFEQFSVNESENRYKFYLCLQHKKRLWLIVHSLKNFVDIKVDIGIFAFQVFVVLYFGRGEYIHCWLKSCLLYDQPKGLCIHVEFDILLLL